jgi:hypothetical protein
MEAFDSEKFIVDVDSRPAVWDMFVCNELQITILPCSVVTRH